MGNCDSICLGNKRYKEAPPDKKYGISFDKQKMEECNLIIVTKID